MQNSNYIKIETASKSLYEWFQITHITEDLETALLDADIVLVPAESPYSPLAFPAGTMELYQYFKEQLKGKVGICINEDEYNEIELNSRVLRLGKFIVTSIAIPLFIGILSNYIYSKLSSPTEVAIPEPNKPEYLEPTTVTFSVIVNDSISGQIKEFNYEGPASEVSTVTESIQNLWNEK